MLYSKTKKLIYLFSKFSIVGIFMTFLSLATAYVFLEILHTPLYITYALNYLVTIFISYQLNRIFTFKARHSTKSLVLYYFIYIIGMGLGLLLLWIFKQILPFGNFILTLCVLPFTMASNFILSKLVFDKVSIKDKKI
jgi:putative flippase GtrA